MNLDNFLMKNEDSRRIFGRKELEIIRKQLNGIALTQSEKNRLSRDIRPKLRFMDEISPFRSEFGLQKNSNNRKIIKLATELMLNDKLNSKIKAILLFGSQVDGQLTPRSDIDICVVFDDISSDEATRFRIRILGSLPKNADIQVFDLLPDMIKIEIARKHRILFSREDFDHLGFCIR